MKRRTDTIGEANPLTGLLFCSDCGSRLFNHRRGEAECSIHFIGSMTANALILEAIKRTSGFAKNNEADFMKLLREESAIKQADAAKSHRRQIAKNKKRIAELDSLLRKTYEDFAAERLTEKRFEQLSGGYESEQAELEKQTAEL
ncbi:MAG: hypothetical protein GX811_09600 [Lentisphaerae bacterium]|nr:hypothetical protein [Lentisphaerota bacterium]